MPGAHDREPGTFWVARRRHEGHVRERVRVRGEQLGAESTSVTRNSSGSACVTYAARDRRAGSSSRSCGLPSSATGVTRTSDSPYAAPAAADDASVNEAGGYAERRFRRGLDSWRRRAVRPLVAMTAPVVLGTLVLAIATGSSPLWFAAGLALGGAGAIVSLVRDDPPPEVANWGRGARGERRTAEVLGALELEGWRVEHDLQRPRGGNVDHLVRGPHGAFLLDTKTVRGRASVEDGVLTVQSRDDDETVWRYRGLRGRLVASAAAVRRDLVHAWVVPVVVVWGEFPSGVVEDRGIAYVHGEELVDWLRSRPQELPLAS
jgi:hypothetical protein